MAKLEDFYPHIEPYAPGVSDITIDRALRDSIRTFCMDSFALREEADPVAVPAGYPAIELSPSESSQVRVIGVHVLTIDGLGRFYPASVDAPPVDGRGRFSSLRDNTVQLLEFLRSPSTARATISVCPLDTAKVFDDRLLEEYRDAIVPGALGRIYRIPGTPAFSAQAGADAMALAAEETRRAGAQALLGKLRGGLRTTPVP